MKNMVVLVDANVILDYVTTREPYYHDAYKVIDMCYSGGVFTRYQLYGMYCGSLCLIMIEGFG